MSRAYALLRITLGLNVCLHGVVRWAAGLEGFARSLLPMFQKTPLPLWSVYDFGFVLPVCETLIGAAVLTGFRTRVALVAGTLFMIVLMFGSALRQDWQTVGIQLTYSVVYCVLIGAVRFDSWGIDGLLNRPV